MLQGLNVIQEVLGTFLDFFIRFFKNLFEIIELIFAGFTYVTQIIVALPTLYQVMLLAFVSYYLIYVIVKLGG